MDATLQADLQGVADKNAASFKVTMDVVPTAPPPPVSETTSFAPGTVPVVITTT